MRAAVMRDTTTAHTIIMTMVTFMMNIAIMTTATINPITVIPMLMTTSTEGGKISSPEAQESAALFRLMTWLSPSFPVGAFSYSSGIEWSVEAGDITDMPSLQNWLAAMLVDGAGFCDGVFVCHAHRAAMDFNAKALGEISELAAAFVPSRERHLETISQGRAFMEIARSAWNCDALDLLPTDRTAQIAYPVAVGVLAAGHEIQLVPALHAFLHAVTSNWISAGVRLIPLGQTDSQRALAALEPIISIAAEKASNATLDDLGSATFRADLASMRHETQYTRLFRS